jgi:hypothetical protein
MNAIRSYIENVFTNLPRTEQVLRVKSDMLANMEEKYHEFKREGRTENEAVGKVISEFGNIDELLAELGISAHSSPKNSEPVYQVSKEEAESWLKTKRQTGALIALGVFLCIAGAAILIFMSAAIDTVEWLPDSLKIRENYVGGIVALLIMVAIAVGLFIYSGVKIEHFDFLKGKFVLKGSLQEWVKDKKNDFIKYYTMSLILGVMLCILAPLVIILPIVVYDAGDIAVQLVVAMILLIGIAVFLFTLFGNIKDAYDQLLKKGDYQETPANNIISLVSSIIWPLAVLFFLLNGFFGMGWGRAWIIFPIIGLLFAVFSGIIKAVKGERD